MPENASLSASTEIQLRRKKKVKNQTDKQNKTHTTNFEFWALTSFAPKDLLPFLSYVSKEGKKRLYIQACKHNESMSKQRPE